MNKSRCFDGFAEIRPKKTQPPDRAVVFILNLSGLFKSDKNSALFGIKAAKSSEFMYLDLQ
jgi:hypothetical protein